MPVQVEGRAAALVAAKGEHVHNFVREWRIHRDLTQQALAAKVGISHVTISMLENGRTGYTQAVLEKLAAALDCTPADLISIDPFLLPPPSPPLSESEQALLNLPDGDKRLVQALLKAIKESDHEQG